MALGIKRRPFWPPPSYRWVLLLNPFRTPSQHRPIEMALISILFLAAFVPSLQGVSLQGVTPDTPMQALVFDKLDELENRIDIDELELELKEI